MRDIKFRVWDKNSETMYKHGYKLTFWEDGSFSVVDALTGDIKPDDNLIIMQYTGLKDKNGKEIYEGDIVECDMIYGNGSLPHMGEIVYCECGSYATKNLCGKTLLHNHRSGTYEIIGNIHETPELLKDEHDESS